MAPSGLRVTQFSLLRKLEQTGASRMSTLAGALLLDRTALSRTLDPLVERGWVAIVAGPDARTREVSLTRAGKLAMVDAKRHWKRAQTQVARRIGVTKLELLIALLGEIEALHPIANVRER